MKFLIGSQNFGLDLPTSDIDYVEFYYPSVSDLCKPIPHAKESKQEDGSIIKRMDVRLIPSLFYKSNLDTIQLLYSKQVINGGEIETYFRENEEAISTLNIPRFYQSVMGTAFNRFKKETTKDLAHIVFGFETLIQFHELGFEDLKSCFNHNKQDYYQSIRNGSYENGLLLAKTLEDVALRLKDDYMNQLPNDVFKRKMDYDFGRLVIQHFKETQG